MLSEGLFYDIVRQALWVAVITSVPILAVALISGLTVGLFQALTSVQEMTLTFVPKLIAIVVVFWMSMDFMTQSLVSFFTSSVIPLVREI